MARASVKTEKKETKAKATKTMVKKTTAVKKAVAKKTTTKKTAEKKVIAKKTISAGVIRKTTSEVKLPAYIKEIYPRLYEDAEISQNFDDNRFWTLVTLGYNNKLANSLCDEIGYQNSVLQIGATFGKQIEKVAMKTGPYGLYDIIDVSKTQVERCRNKYIYRYPAVNFIHADAAVGISGKYDVVVCYMLLHEVPDPTKRKIVNNVLGALKTGGKAVFIDYHNPSKMNPLRYFVRIFNRLYQPFAESLWKNDIKDFAENAKEYSWKKTLFFGCMYQKLVVKRKNK